MYANLTFKKNYETIMSGFSFKTSKRRLGTGRKMIYAIKKTGEKNTYNKNGIIKVVEILQGLVQFQ